MANKIFGIDFGTSRIKIYKNNTGVVLNEQNLVAIADKKTVMAVGEEAFEMFEKAPANILVSYPVKNGVIADLANMQALLNTVLLKLSGKGKKVGHADFIVAVPTDITDVEKRAFYDLIVSSLAKVRSVGIVEKPIADALGVGLDVTTARGVMTVNIGADTTEISILSLGGIVLSKLVSVGGNRLDESIKLFVKKKYNLIIGDKTAEIIKKELADASPKEEASIKVYGRNVVSGLPTEMEISSEMVYESIKEYLYTIIDSIKIILERTPPEISADIIDSGIYITGGSARIKNLDKLIFEETELPINICENAENTVVLGLGKIIDDPELATLATTARQNNYGSKLRD